MEACAPANAARRAVEVAENVAIARDTYRIRLIDPEMAAAIRPGQFVMVRPTGGHDPLLGRPFALYDVVDDEAGRPHAIDLVYLVIGRGTSALAGRNRGDRVEIWGPLGNGFASPPGGPTLCVAGGIGQTPFLALARWWANGRSYAGVTPAERSAVTLLYGARSAAYLAGLSDFSAHGLPCEVATDDGSQGHHGYVTDLLCARLEHPNRPAQLIACGPAPMLAAVSKIAQNEGIACLLSLENHMACGFGACFSCVTPIRQADGSTDLKRVCVEGPIFDAKDVVFA